MSRDDDVRRHAPGVDLVPSAIDLVASTRGLTRVLALGILLCAVVVIGAISTLAVGPGSPIALWWPASAVSTVVLLLAPHRRWSVSLLLGGAILLSLLIGGRELDSSLVYAPIGVLEAWIVAISLYRRGRIVHLASGREMTVFVGGVVAGVTAAAFGVSATVFLDEPEAVFRTAIEVLASHGSALLLILPVLLCRRRAGARMLAEQIVQTAVLLVLIIVIFAPGQSLPLEFLIFPVIAWAAFRFSTWYVAAQLLCGSAIMIALSLGRSGPFASPNPYELSIDAGLLQLFVMSIAAPALFLSAIRSEQAERDAFVAERERLLTDGLTRARVGFVLLERLPDGTVDIIEQNSEARRLLPASPSHRMTDSSDPASLALWRVLAAVDGASGEWSGDLLTEEGLQLEVRAVPFTVGFRRLVTVDVADVTAQRSAESATRIALERERASAQELRELYRRQEEFVASVSHDFRTPLTSIIGFADGLHDELDGSARLEMEVILRNARRLAVLVDDLLAVGASAVASTGESIVAIDDIVRECVEDQRRYADSLGVHLALTPEACGGHVRASPDVMSRIMTNLLSNAIKFAARPGAVTIGARMEGGSVEVLIVDDGLGIPEHEKERVFERFYRSSEPELAKRPGTGLGLPIVRNLVQGLGGDVRLDRGSAGGTVARLLVPVVGDAER